MRNMTDIQESVAQAVGFGTSEGDSLRASEAVSVFVTTTDEIMALSVAPMLAARLYPERCFGQVLHLEPGSFFGYDGLICDVEVNMAGSISVSRIQNNR